MKALEPSGPTRIGPFRVLGVLGQGGMGRVLLGAGPDGRLVAVKQVLAHFADDEGFRARFRREVTASRKVAGAYTAAVIDADPDAPTPWLASVFVAGPSLGAVVKAAGVLPEDVVRRLAAGLASALAEIDRAGLVHRDLKPDNVLLAEDGVRVIDLGIARETEGEAEGDAGLTRTGLVVGSPAYMSPEQAEGKPLTPASDVFSLGSVLAMAATGRSPFAGPSTFQTLYDVVHTEPDLSGVPAGLLEVVAGCLAKDPAARPSPARLRELIGPVAPAGRQWPDAVYGMLAAQRAEIDGLLGGHPAGDPEPHAPEPVPVPEPQDAPPPQSPRRGRRRITALAAAGVLLVAGTGVVAYVRDRMNAHVAYTAVPSCQQAARTLPLAVPVTSSGTSGTRSGCTWDGSGLAEAPRALVRWDLSLGGDADANAAAQKRRFQGEAAGQREAARLGFGTEAYWGSPGADWTCVLAVREGNLSVWTGLRAKPYTKAACETKAKEVARAALKAATR
ncbi:serine/threonine-protein kinase [Streptomyces sp. NBC_00162]|uniref:serine/threonine-protein kinase n=1 Tax=Streptomyces sp. NBC_00162 TaxID=2903629 RepID=UPI00214C347D|nr:serine/threonine-protein kinase [Streptomyces sp. NBC_00162]UUU42230.1 serine/threonine protein kinase [Streptomyces sp. NBC_00162]